MFSASLSLAQLMAQVLSGQFSHMWQKPLSLQMTSLIDIKCLSAQDHSLGSEQCLISKLWFECPFNVLGQSINN